jgi:hypothetical protein
LFTPRLQPDQPIKQRIEALPFPGVQIDPANLLDHLFEAFQLLQNAAGADCPPSAAQCSMKTASPQFPPDDE